VLRQIFFLCPEASVIQSEIVHKVFSFGLALWFCVLFTQATRAQTFQLNDGRSVSGEMLVPSANDAGIQIRVGEGQYERVPWGKFSQEDLRKLAENPKLQPFVEPFIEVTQAELIKKTDIGPIKPTPRLERPAPRSLLGALFGSSIGILAILLMYAANLFAAYEVAIFRAQPIGLVCGVAAVLPLIGPIIFLSMPTRMSGRYQEQDAEAAAAAEAATPTFSVPSGQPEQGTGEAGGGLRLAHADPAEAAKTAQAQVFARGQYTFNRRFFETKFPGFFGVVRREAERGLVLIFKTSRGEFIAHRITRIASGDLHVDVVRGSQTEEVMISFPEIQEVQLKHAHA
jgi:hypothetical protein